jgi:hypothetical protein
MMTGTNIALPILQESPSKRVIFEDGYIPTFISEEILCQFIEQ